MNTVVKIRDMVLGEGLPKICVPIVGKTKEEVLASAENIMPHTPDIIEWRLDFLENVKELEAVKELSQILREKIGDTPLLATFRTKAEGGEQELLDEEYIALYDALMDAGCIDVIDVEVFLKEETTACLIKEAHEKGVKVIGSNHDFHKTPEKEEIIRRLCLMQEKGMDIAKMAVMPQTTEDLLTLLDATRIMKEEHTKTPVITMSMSGKGVLSRLTGEIFGSALTFGTVGKASAPGQVPVEELRNMMRLLHDFS